MAQFEIHSKEGTRWVTAKIDNDSITAEAGALSYMIGNITMHSPFFISPTAFIKSTLAGEPPVRPRYTGTGTITLESSLGGFHVIEVGNSDWILEPGAYWASDSRVDVSYHRESVLTSLWAGKGLVYLQTRVTGRGQCILHTRGPVEELTIQSDKIVVAESPFIIARTSNVSMKVRRPTNNFLGRFTSKEPFVREFRTTGDGIGRVLVLEAQYWRQLVLARKSQDPLEYE